MNLYYHLYTIILVFNILYGVNSREGKVTGGHEARPYSNPYVVSLQTRFLWWRSRICTGSIISRRWILSAGHCVTDSWARWFSMDAIVGAHSLKVISDSQIYSITYRVAHPMYRGNVGPYDIGMMKTSRNIKYSPKVQPIRLPTNNPPLNINDRLLLTGWGALSSNMYLIEIPNKLQEVVVSYLPYYECYNAVDKILDKDETNPLKRRANICTGPITGGVAGCSGDSGGPLVQYVRASNENEETSTASSISPIPVSTDRTTTESTSSSVPITTDTSTTVTEESTFSPTPMTTDRTASTTTTPFSPTPMTTDRTASTTTRPFSPTPMTTDRPLSTTPGNAYLTFGRNATSLKEGMIPTIIGVLSWGVVPCGAKGAPTVYSNVTNYMDFINKYLNSN